MENRKDGYDFDGGDKFINNLGDKDNCHVFAFKLWDEMVELGEIPGT
jgi:hypothetical protein